MYLDKQTFKKNVVMLKEYFLFSYDDFKRFFNFDYEELIIMKEEDINFQGCLEKSVLLTESFVNHDSDYRLKHLIEVLHVMYNLSYETISKFAGIRQEEILGYLQNSNVITEQQKFECCSKLTLLDRVIANMIPTNYITKNN
ncbi:hypothetical protein AFU33_13320 [Listeria monocytogenes]|nr:hypothetical protein [Listeria monocytogenes]EAC4365474.1 hypothetical protein [Listeria monocytogenes]EAD0431788.1 hypothetical protein [Listeria monocytogenes]EAD4838563.1 hypothetical protein [Listeria monocytogenes]EAF0657285.1 hypothetical protein [Listeria monocytogenes]